MAELQRGAAASAHQNDRPRRAARALGRRTRAALALGAAGLIALVVGVVAVRMQAPPPHVVTAPSIPSISLDLAGAAGSPISAQLFGLGVDLPQATYAKPSDTSCAALANVGNGVTLVRIGAATADNYDWRTDDVIPPQGGHGHPASFGCFTAQGRPATGTAASVLRLLDRVRALGATAVVVLNGETDDPQSAAALARFIAGRYGTSFAQRLYWEIGNAPSSWQHFGVPLDERHPDDVVPCLPDQYAALVTTYAAALAAALDMPSPLIVADEWIANATDQSWVYVVKAIDTQYYPFNSPDIVPSGPTAVARGVTQPGGPGGVALDQLLFSLRANLDEYDGGHNMPLFVGAWNADANAQAASPLYGSGAQAVFVANLLLHFMRARVSMSAWAQPLYKSSPGTTQAPFEPSGDPTLAYRVLGALRVLGGARQLALTVAAGSHGGVLDALAARLPNGRAVLVLTNASARALPVHLGIRGATTPATGTAGGKSAAAPATGATRPSGYVARYYSDTGPPSGALPPDGGTLTLPPLSVTVVTPTA